MDADKINLDGFKLAKSRINGKVRETPLLKSQPLKKDLNPQGSLSLKLENLQPTGSFKVRGAINALHTLTQAQKNKGLITASGGNHGLAVAYAAFLADVPAVIYLPASTNSTNTARISITAIATVITPRQILQRIFAQAHCPVLFCFHSPFSSPRLHRAYVQRSKGHPRATRSRRRAHRRAGPQRPRGRGEPPRPHLLPCGERIHLHADAHGGRDLLLRGRIN